MSSRVGKPISGYSPKPLSEYPFQISEPIKSELDEDELNVNPIKFTPYHRRLDKPLSDGENKDSLTASRVKSRSAERIQNYFRNVRELKKVVISSLLHKNNDIRPFSQIQILGQPYLALLDSGANKSVIGGALAKRILAEKNNFESRKGMVKTADGQMQNIAGVITVSLTFNTKHDSIEFLIVPSINQDVICGMDFWKKFGISLSLVGNISEINQTEGETEKDQIHLSPSEKRRLKSVINSFPSFEVDGLGKTSLVEHSIDTGEAKPIKQRFYPLSPAREKLLCEEIDRMIAQDVIEEAPSSAWSSPVTLLVKPNKVRFCLDARKLNSVTIKDAYPMPILEGLLSRLPPVHCISKIDLKDAFWQIELDSQSRAKTAFTVPNRPLYQFKRMPFGLSNAPQTLCRLMDMVIPYNMKSHVLVYLDDLLVLSSTFEDHLKHLAEVAVQLRKAGLTINVAKSQFGLKQVQYLGFIVGEGTLQTNSEKVRAVAEFPVPNTQKQLRRFLGMTGWYQRFLSQYSTVIFPLTELLGKKAFKWNEQAQSAFEEIKKRLCSAPLLMHPNYEKPFIVQCDASFHGVGAVLAQLDDDNVERPIAYMSKKLNKAQRNYTVTEIECLAVVLAVLKFRMYIEGHPFKIVTDHASLRWLMKQTDLSGRLARWALKLQRYTFQIEHRKGSQNIVPDALSRSFEEPDAVNAIEVELSPTIDLTSSAFQSEEYTALKDKFIEAGLPDFQVIDNFLYHRNCFSTNGNRDEVWKLYVPTALREEVIRSSHDQPSSAHGGVAKCLERIRRNFFWPGLASDVRQYIAKCELCRTSKYPNYSQRPPMGSQIISERPFQRLYIDFIGPFPRSKKGNIGIFIILDHFSKFTFLKPVRKFSSQIIIDFLRDEIFACFGVPESIVSDNGSQFKSHEFAAFLTKYGIKHICTASYAPQANAAERVNRSINAALRTYVRHNQREWDIILPSINCALRNSIHQSVGADPYRIVFGQYMITHGKDYTLLRKLDLLNSGAGHIEREDEFTNIRDDIGKYLKRAFSKNRRTYDLRARPKSFEVGEEVIKRNFQLSNLASNFNAKLGPIGIKARIKQKVGSAIYRLEDLKGKELGNFHAKDIWKA